MRFLIFNIIIAGVFVSAPAQARPLRVATASDLASATDDLKAAFLKIAPGVELEFVIGASGTLAQQIRSAAPFDIFMSADDAYPAQLAKEGLTEGDAFPYATGHLVVWLPKRTGHDLPAAFKLDDLKSADYAKIAIGEPSHVPYGRLAKETLEHANLFDTLSPKLVRAESVAMAAQFALTGAAQAGLIARSLAFQPRFTRAGKMYEILGAPTLKQVGVVLKKSAQKENDRLFRDFILSETGRAILHAHGLD